MNRCLYCYKIIENEIQANNEFHESCSMKFFGSKEPPLLDVTQSELFELAKKVVQSQRTITGVQPKLSLSKAKKEKGSNNRSKLTIVGLWGNYILKPQTNQFKSLPELEDLTMHLAQLSKINTVPHSLIRLKSGELAYISKRVDRNAKRKFHMEDMCQLTEKQTEYKYRGSYEQVAKALKKYSANPGFDLVNFFEILLFCFFTGNNDMHLKNFSLLKNENKEYNLCPAYDLIASELVVEGDDEELALNINGKKKKLKRNDFETAMKNSGINDIAIRNIFKKFENITNTWSEFIHHSFLSDELKQRYIAMLNVKFKQLNYS